MKTTLPYQLVTNPHHHAAIYCVCVHVFAEQEHHVDQLLRPKHFPGSVLQYTLKELTIVWHLYGGHDFTPHPLTPSSPASPSPHLPHTTSTTPQPSSSRARTTQSPSVRGFSSPTQLGSRSSGTSVVGGKGRGRGGGGRRCGWNFSGGPGRDHTVHMEIEIDKVNKHWSFHDHSGAVEPIVCGFLSSIKCTCHCIHFSSEF